MTTRPDSFAACAAIMAFLVACAGAPPQVPPPPVAPTVLAQTLPLGSRATYTIVDTVRVEADGERVRFRTRAAYEAEVRMRFRTAGDTLLASATLSRLAGSLENPTTGSVVVSLDDVDGDWVAAIGRDGSVTPVATPSLTDRFREVVGTADLLRALFVRLPDGPAVEGTQWVDTLVTSDAGAGASRSTTTVGRSRVAERTLVAGRPVLIIESVLDVTIEAQTDARSDEPSRQSLRGTIRRRTTWDAGLRRLTHYRATGRLVGELRVEGLDPIPLTADIVREVTGT
jgi:hypothetical protein